MLLVPTTLHKWWRLIGQFVMANRSTTKHACNTCQVSSSHCRGVEDELAGLDSPNRLRTVITASKPEKNRYWCKFCAMKQTFKGSKHVCELFFILQVGNWTQGARETEKNVHLLTGCEIRSVAKSQQGRHGLPVGLHGKEQQTRPSVLFILKKVELVKVDGMGITQTQQHNTVISESAEAGPSDRTNNLRLSGLS